MTTVRRSAQVLVFALVGLWCTGAAAAGAPFDTELAQLTLPAATPQPVASGLIVSGLYVTAPAMLDGNVVFRIGAPVNQPVTQMPIAARVENVQTALNQLVAETGTGTHATTNFDPGTLRIHVKREGDVAVLLALDAKHPDPLSIVTITSVDARANGTNVDALAAQWQSSLQSALVRALVLRQPAVEKRSLQSVGQVAAALGAMSLIIMAILRLLWRRMEALEAKVSERARSVDAAAPSAPEQPAADAQRRRFFALALRNLEPVQRLRLYGAIHETLLWSILLGWFIGVTWALSLFAATSPLAQTITHGGVDVAAIVIATGLLNRILDIVIARGATAWRIRRSNSSEDRARLLLRIPTISRAVAGAKTGVLVFIAILSVFGQVGVPIGSVVTIGGLAAIALSLSAQNFVRDFLNGFLVLFEDQYVVGDYVTINAFSGSVETLTLRMVQIRDAAGDLITIPHSSVINVVNQSRNWSRVDYRVPVDPASDIARAVEIVAAQIAALAAEGDWLHGTTEPIEWIGIDGLSKDGIIVRASIKTAPLRQFELKRQINERVRAEFVQAGIAFGAPLPVA